MTLPLWTSDAGDRFQWMSNDVGRIALSRNNCSGSPQPYTPRRPIRGVHVLVNLSDCARCAGSRGLCEFYPVASRGSVLSVANLFEDAADALDRFRRCDV